MAVTFSRLEWTAEKPRVAGWYWWEIPSGIESVANFLLDGKKATRLVVEIDVQPWDLKLYVDMSHADGDNPLLDFLLGRWAGPLPEPLEPSPVARNQNTTIQ